MKIHLPPETWTNVFLFLDRKLLAIRSEQLNNRKICELLVWCIHETWLRSRQLNDIIICSPDCTEAAVLDPLKKLWPIAETPVPLNIVSFKQIWIRIFDGRVLEFFLQLRPLLAAVSVTLWIDNNQMNSHKAADQNLVVLCHLLPLVRSIKSIYIRCITDFSNLFRHLIAFKEQLLQVGLQNSPIPFHPYVSRAKFAVVRFIGLARKRKPGEGQNVEDRVIDAVILGAFREISQNG